MLQRAKQLGCQLRPHMKTHKTIQGGLTKPEDHTWMTEYDMPYQTKTQQADIDADVRSSFGSWWGLYWIVDADDASCWSGPRWTATPVALRQKVATARGRGVSFLQRGWMTVWS